LGKLHKTRETRDKKGWRDFIRTYALQGVKGLKSNKSLGKLTKYNAETTASKAKLYNLKSLILASYKITPTPQHFILIVSTATS